MRLATINGRRATLVGGICVLATAASVFAKPNEEYYECRILEAYRVSETGILEPGSWDGDPRGGRFTVSRESGVVIGEWLTTLRASKTEVTQTGNSEWGFQAVARFPNEHGEHVQTIYVEHFAPGAEKPFVATSLGGVGVATGVCRLR